MEPLGNDLGSGGMGNLVDKPVQMDTEVASDGINFEGGNGSVKVKQSVQGERGGDGVSSQAVDGSLNFEQGVQGEQRGDTISHEAVDGSLNFEHASENQGGVVNGFVQSEEPGNAMSLEGVDVSLECGHILENQGGADESVQVEQTGDVIALEGMNISLIFDDVTENQGEGTHESVQGEEPFSVEKADLEEAGPDGVQVEQNAEIECDAIHSPPMEALQISLDELVEKLQSDVPKNCGKIEDNECDACDILASPNVQATLPLEELGEKARVIVLGLGCPVPGEVSKRGRKPKNAGAMDSSQQSSVERTRGLRSRSKEISKDSEPGVDVETTTGSNGRRGRRKHNEKDGKADNEFSRMKKHLRYQLHRISYNQNLLDAYASEGWRGQSLEKLRPEKELQRAKADINRSKLKIRDLFQRLNSMSAEGKFPETLYDSEGLIDSEDIFCAKCGSKDLPIGNDIILCDGICERGFHQYCLDPPLRTEEIPPGDEGWLCPACDCKLDCVELVNDSLGTKLKIEDTWEKVFPEAIAAMDGKEVDDIMGLPSDDSEDNEYNPDGTEDDANVEVNESSSDESDSNESESDSSDFSSASEDLGAICGTEQNLGLPSDDSEDDDYDPDAKNVDEEEIAHESSGSDFTSASENLGPAIGDDSTSNKGEPPLTLEQEQDLGESAPMTSKRCVEKLDYKKLYDETYGNLASDSSDDEEWMDRVATRKRKSSAEKAVPLLSTGASDSADGACGSGTSRRRGRQKTNLQGANGLSAQLQENSPQTSSRGRRGKPYNRLGEAVTQRLYEAFKENKFPDRQAKEKLANELGLTAHRVDKWFGNARWSLNHHPSRVEAILSRSVSHSNTSSSVACNGGGNALASNAGVDCGSGGTTKMDATSEKATPRKSRKNNTENYRSMTETENAENSKEAIQMDPLQTPEAPQGRTQRKRRKSGL